MAATSRPDEFLEYRLVRLAESLRRRFATIVEPYGLTPQQFSALFVLATKPYTTVADLSRQILMTPQGAAKLVSNLEDDGLVSRPSGRTRGKKAPITLTTTGTDRLAAATNAVKAAEMQSRTALGSAGSQALSDLLAVLEAQFLLEP